MHSYLEYGTRKGCFDAVGRYLPRSSKPLASWIAGFLSAVVRKVEENFSASILPDAFKSHLRSLPAWEPTSLYTANTKLMETVFGQRAIKYSEKRCIYTTWYDYAHSVELKTIDPRAFHSLAVFHSGARDRDVTLYHGSSIDERTITMVVVTNQSLYQRSQGYRLDLTRIMPGTQQNIRNT